MSIRVGHFVLSPRERKKREEIVEEIKEKDREPFNLNKVFIWGKLFWSRPGARHIVSKTDAQTSKILQVENSLD